MENSSQENHKAEEELTPAISTARKVCTACGTVNEPSSIYCYKCGVKLPTETYTGAEVGNPAGFWIRFLAFIIDQVFLTIMGIAITLIFTDASLGEVLARLFDPDAQMSAGEFFVGMIIEVAYYTITIGTWGKTVGKAMLRLKVTRVDGSKLSYKRSFARYWAYYLSALPIGLGFIAIALSSKKRGLHDLICDTRVLRVKN